MRTPTITTPLDDSCDPAGWRAEAVDPRGWLAGAGSSSPLPRVDPSQNEGEPAGSVGRAAARAARPATGARRRRRMHPRTTARSRSLAVDQPIAEEAKLSAPLDEPTVEGYRMGRWARLTLTITVLAAIAVVTVSLTVGSAPRSLVDVMVGPGDSLWSIAAQAAPDRDPRDVIEEIKELNDVPDGALPVGIVLRVPAAAE